jgi:hypothetical protein
MMGRMKALSVLAPLVLAAVFAVPSMGCKRLAERAAEKAEEKALEKSTGGQVSVDGKKGTLTIVTDAGEVMLGNTAKIPADFPKVVPVYAGAQPKMAVQSAQNGKEAWTISLETPDSKDKVVAFYKANMSGFTVASTMDMGTSSMTVYQSPKYDVTVMVSAEAKTTGLSLSVSSK